MNCMKCGREISLGQVFCKDCLADMAQYPVAPDTPVPVFAPPASVSVKRSSPARKQRKPEEQIIHLKKWIKGLSLTLAAVILIFSVITALLINQINQDQDKTTPGQNYSTSENAK